MAQFSQDISEFVKVTKLSMDLVVRVIALNAFELLLLNSPVDTGRFRGNWRIGLKTPDLTVLETKNRRFNAAERLEKANAGTVIWLTNNLVYGPRLERGYSKQAPGGILKPTIIMLQNNMNEMVKKAKEQANAL